MQLKARINKNYFVVKLRFLLYKYEWRCLCFICLEVELELLTDIDMLLMVEKGIRGGICHAIHRHATANNRYMKEYNKDNGSSYIMYWDAKQILGWAMSQKLPVDGFEWKKICLNLMGLHCIQ